MKLRPDTHIIEKLRERPFTWRDAFAEITHGRFETGATEVILRIDGNDLVATDNGGGCVDLAGMLTLGHSLRSSPLQGGQGVISFADVSIWLGATTEIDTVRGNQRMVASADWDEVERSGRWEIPDLQVSEVREKSRKGTILRFGRLYHVAPNGSALHRLASELGYLFAPAIAGSRRIVLQHDATEIVAPRYELPPFVDAVEKELSVDDTRVRLRVGIVAKDVPNPYPGITYVHGIRVILPASDLGCGTRYSYERVAGWVELDQDWNLRWSPDLLVAHQRKLGAAVYAACRVLLAKAAGVASA